MHELNLYYIDTIYYNLYAHTKEPSLFYTKLKVNQILYWFTRKNIDQNYGHNPNIWMVFFWFFFFDFGTTRFHACTMRDVMRLTCFVSVWAQSIRRFNFALEIHFDWFVRGLFFGITK